MDDMRLHRAVACQSAGVFQQAAEILLPLYFAYKTSLLQSRLS